MEEFLICDFRFAIGEGRRIPHGVPRFREPRQVRSLPGERTRLYKNSHLTPPSPPRGKGWNILE